MKTHLEQITEMNFKFRQRSLEQNKVPNKLTQINLEYEFPIRYLLVHFDRL